MGTQDAFEDCPFCQIVNNQTDTEILLSVSWDSCLFIGKFIKIPDWSTLSFSISLSSQDDELVCFRDMKPGAAHHYLVVPRIHIDNCKTLQKDNIPLGERVLNLNREFLPNLSLGWSSTEKDESTMTDYRKMSPTSDIVWKCQDSPMFFVFF